MKGQKRGKVAADAHGEYNTEVRGLAQLKTGLPKPASHLLAVHLFAAYAAYCCPPTTQAGSFTIDQWVLGTGIDDRNGIYQFEVFDAVVNPFSDAHSVTVAGSSTSALYDFAWRDANGTFVVQSSQQAEGVPPSSWLFTTSGGNIYVTPSEDLALSIDASWTYNLPRYYMDTTLLVSVYGVNSHLSLFSQNTGGQTSYPDPASGTVAITGNVVLPPTDTWVLRYDMNIKTFSGTQGHTATGSGYVNFQLSPEPASVALVALGLLILTRCRHYAP